MQIVVCTYWHESIIIKQRMYEGRYRKYHRRLCFVGTLYQSSWNPQFVLHCHYKKLENKNNISEIIVSCIIVWFHIFNNTNSFKWHFLNNSKRKFDIHFFLFYGLVFMAQNNSKWYQNRLPLCHFYIFQLSYMFPSWENRKYLFHYIFLFFFGGLTFSFVMSQTVIFWIA